MSLAIPIETSARHIHLCEEDFHTLFGEGGGLTYKADLSQPGQYVCEERLTIQQKWAEELQSGIHRL